MWVLLERASFFLLPRSFSFANMEEFPSEPRGEEDMKEGDEGDEGARFHSSMGTSNLEGGLSLIHN